MALATAVQFDTVLRQKDVIGEWEPISADASATGIVFGRQRWVSGLTWADVVLDGVTRKITSKTGAIAAHDLTLCPHVQRVAALIPVEKRIGPLVVDERTGRPYAETKFAQAWRQIARAAGTLSLVAKVIAGRILGHHNVITGQCSPSYDTLAKGACLERRSAIRAVRELETAGWISVIRVSGGHASAAKGFVTNSFRLHLTRVEESLPPVTGETLPPGVQLDTPRVSHQALPPVSNQTPPECLVSHPPGVSSQTPEHMKLEHGKGTREESISRTRAPRSKVQVDDEAFGAFYGAYPRKVGRDKAREAYGRVIADGRTTAPELVAAATRFAAERADQDPTFTPHPATWLNQGRWADEPAQRSTPARQPAQRRAFSALEHVAAGMDDDD